MRRIPSNKKRNLARKKYAKPEVITATGHKARTYSSAIRYGLRRGRKNLEFYSRENVDPDRLAMQWELLESGIPVEEPFERKPKGPNRLMGYFSMGDATVEDVLERLSPKEKRSVAKQMISLISRIHNKGMIFKHPHLQNIAIQKGRVRIGLFDFKLISRVNVDWHNPKSIFDSFRVEYGTLRNNMIKLGLSLAEQESLFEALISRYARLPNTEKSNLYQLVRTRVLL
ncbi:MAG: hypothetical protein AABW72_05520 [archaeon]